MLQHSSSSPLLNSTTLPPFYLHCSCSQWLLQVHSQHWGQPMKQSRPEWFDNTRSWFKPALKAQSLCLHTPATIHRTAWSHRLSLSPSQWWNYFLTSQQQSFIFQRRPETHLFCFHLAQTSSPSLSDSTSLWGSPLNQPWHTQTSVICYWTFNSRV